MPILGRFYQAEELAKLLGVTKQRVSNLAREQDWSGPQPGLYWSQDVEPYLENRGINPLHIPIRSYETEQIEIATSVKAAAGLEKAPSRE